MTAAGESDSDDRWLQSVCRGWKVDDQDIDLIAGYWSDRMRTKAPLVSKEEGMFFRRIDLHIMPLCAIAFLLKNIDVINVSTTRTINYDSDPNLLTQFWMKRMTLTLFAPYIMCLFNRLLFTLNPDNFTVSPYHCWAPSNFFVKRISPSIGSLEPNSRMWFYSTELLLVPTWRDVSASFVFQDSWEVQDCS